MKIILDEKKIVKNKTSTLNVVPEEPKNAPGKNRAMGAKFMAKGGVSSTSSRQVMTSKKINEFSPFDKVVVGNSTRNIQTNKLSAAKKPKK